MSPKRHTATRVTRGRGLGGALKENPVGIQSACSAQCLWKLELTQTQMTQKPAGGSGRACVKQSDRKRRGGGSERAQRPLGALAQVCVSCVGELPGPSKSDTIARRNEHRGALRGTPGSACPQPKPNATELPSCGPISARTAQRQGGGGGDGGVAMRARAARAPKAKS